MWLQGGLSGCAFLKPRPRLVRVFGGGGGQLRDACPRQAKTLEKNGAGMEMRPPWPQRRAFPGRFVRKISDQNKERQLKRHHIGRERGLKIVGPKKG